MSAVSQLHVEDGQLFVRVSPGHSISEEWLLEHAADLYATWLTRADGPARDHLAAEMEHRLEEVEPSEPPAKTKTWAAEHTAPHRDHIRDEMNRGGPALRGPRRGSARCRDRRAPSSRGD